MTSSHFNTPALFPVIHVLDPDTSKANAELVVRENCAGLFLICHDDDGVQTDLWKSFEAVRAEFPHLWIGVNMLGVDPFEALATVREKDVQGLWTDDLPAQPTLSEWEICRPDWHGAYFGGVAFKYQPQEGSLEDQAKRAVLLVDVITTSGDGTGEAPHRGKIMEIRRALPPNKPLAVASGVDPCNIKSFVQHGADAFLVASSISYDFHHLDPVKLRRLALHMH